MSTWRLACELVVRDHTSKEELCNLEEAIHFTISESSYNYLILGARE
jgi:hypothetical protein